MQIGEAFVGSGADAAHINTVLGHRDGPVGVAWATALATPRAGHVAFVTVVQPGLAVQPPTLFVNKATLAGERHSKLTWGAAQAGVAGGVLDAVAAGVVDAAAVGDLVLIAAVWVDPDAADEAAVYLNNRHATHAALATGRAGGASLDAVLDARDVAYNPFFEAR